MRAAFQGADFRRDRPVSESRQEASRPGSPARHGKEVLGPRGNTTETNVIASIIIIGVLGPLSLTLSAAVLFPDLWGTPT